jgi:hypothetical protein
MFERDALLMTFIVYILDKVLGNVCCKNMNAFDDFHVEGANARIGMDSRSGWVRGIDVHSWTLGSSNV